MNKLIRERGRMELGDWEAVRFYQTQGDGFSGWVVRSKYDSYSYSDPILNPRRAEQELRRMAASQG